MLNFHRNFPFLLAAKFVLLFTAAFHNQVHSQDSLAHSTSLHAAIDLTSYSGSNVNGGVGSDFGAHQHIFFHKILGAFVGIDFVGRKMNLNEVETTRWLDIPFGLSFRYGGAIEGSRNTLDLGLVYMANQTVSTADTGIGELQSVLGLFFRGTSLFPITETFDLGLYGSIKFGFSSPFAALEGVTTLSSAIGIEGRFRY